MSYKPAQAEKLQVRIDRWLLVMHTANISRNVLNRISSSTQPPQAYKVTITVGFNRRNKGSRNLALATSKTMWLKPIIIVQR